MSLLLDITPCCNRFQVIAASRAANSLNAVPRRNNVFFARIQNSLYTSGAEILVSKTERTLQRIFCTNQNYNYASLYTIDLDLYLEVSLSLPRHIKTLLLILRLKVVFSRDHIFSEWANLMLPHLLSAM